MATSSSRNTLSLSSSEQTQMSELEYETDFKLMHRAMRKRLDDFQGTRKEPKSAAQAKLEVYKNMPLLRGSSQSCKEEVILEYLLSREEFRESHLGTEQAMAAAIKMMREKYDWFCKLLPDSVIRMAEYENERTKADVQMMLKARTISGELTVLKRYISVLF